MDAAREYDQLLQKYMDDVGEDLCKGMQPPKSVRIAVKVKEDFGQFSFSAPLPHLPPHTSLTTPHFTDHSTLPSLLMLPVKIN